MLFKSEIKHSDQPTMPGEFIHLSDYEYHPTELELIDYSSSGFTEKKNPDPGEIADMIDNESVTWLNVTGLKNLECLEELQTLFNIHPLVIEDILRPFQRPKLEWYDENLFVILRLIHVDEELTTEQLGMVIGENYLLTFQEFPGDAFDPVRKRIREGRKKVCSSGPDYLAYALLDAAVDSYFPFLEELGYNIELLEDQILEEPKQENLVTLHHHKRSLLVLRRAAWAQREMLGQLQREEHDLISNHARVFIRDTYDHAIRVLEIIESYREMASSLTDLHMTSISNRMNEIMKVLTIIGTIFLPLTFIAGVYGMNFDFEASPYNMPELYWYWGYPVVMILMLSIALTLLFVFRKKSWI